jgi:uncharacterized membrane protein
MKILNYLKEHYFLTTILVVGTILRLYHLDFQSLWMDEIYTMNVANPNQSFGTLIDEVNLREGFPYFYFMVLKILFAIFGHTAIVARFFSVLFGFLSIYAIYKLGKALISKEVGWFAALLMAINEYNIYISQDARPYTLYLFATILSFYYLSKIIKDNSQKNAIYYGLSLGFLLNINFFSFINIFSQSIIILFYLIISDKKSLKFQIKNYAIAAIISFIMLLPNYKMIVKLLTIKSFWIPKPTPDSFSLMFKEFLGNSEMTLFVFTPLFFYFLFNLFKEKETKNIDEIKSNKMIFASTLFFGWVFIFITFLTVRSQGEISLILTRYFTSIIPVFFLVLGVGIYLVHNKVVRFLLLSTIVIYTLINLIAVKKYYKYPSKAQFREASEFVITKNNQLEKTYTSQKYWFDYYFNDKTTKIKLEEVEFEILIQQMQQDPSKVKSFWFTDAFLKPYLPSESAQKFIDANFYIESSYDGFQAWTRHFTLLTEAPKAIDISKFKDLQTYNGDSFMLNVETFENSNNTLKIIGWAYFDKQPSEKSEVSVLLIKDGKVQRLISQKVNRPDVTTYFKCDFDASNSGFTVTTDISTLEKGKYQLAIYVLNPDTKKEGLVLTDKFVEK